MCIFLQHKIKSYQNNVEPLNNVLQPGHQNPRFPHARQPDLPAPLPPSADQTVHQRGPVPPERLLPAAPVGQRQRQPGGQPRERRKHEPATWRRRRRGNFPFRGQLSPGQRRPEVRSAAQRVEQERDVRAAGAGNEVRPDRLLPAAHRPLRLIPGDSSPPGPLVPRPPRHFSRRPRAHVRLERLPARPAAVRGGCGGREDG